MDNFCIWCRAGFQLYSFAYGYSVFPASFVEERIFFPNEFTSVENQLATDKWAYFWTLNFIPLVYMFILILLPHCFGDYSFVVSLKLQTLSPSFVLFQNCFETVPKFRAPVTICELEKLFFRPWKQKAVWIWYRLHWICRSLWVALLSSNSNTHEHRMFFCLGLT